MPAGAAFFDLDRTLLRGASGPIIGEALFLEYEDVLSRSGLMAKSPLSPVEQRQLLEKLREVESREPGPESRSFFEKVKDIFA